MSTVGYSFKTKTSNTFKCITALLQFCYMLVAMLMSICISGNIIQNDVIKQRVTSTLDFTILA